MRRADIRLNLKRQLKEDYPKVPTYLCAIRDLYRTDVPTFLVTIAGGERRIYSFIPIGEEDAWISCSINEYLWEEKRVWLVTM